MLTIKGIVKNFFREMASVMTGEMSNLVPYENILAPVRHMISPDVLLDDIHGSAAAKGWSTLAKILQHCPEIRELPYQGSYTRRELEELWQSALKIEYSVETRPGHEYYSLHSDIKKILKNAQYLAAAARAFETEGTILRLHEETPQHNAVTSIFSRNTLAASEAAGRECARHLFTFIGALQNSFPEKIHMVLSPPSQDGPPRMSAPSPLSNRRSQREP